MTITFRASNSLTEAEDTQLFRWSPDPYNVKGWGITWRPKDNHFVACDQDVPVGHVGLVRETIRVGEVRLEVGGVGSVILVPQYQGKGLARVLLDRAEEEIFEVWKLNHAVLFCLPEKKNLYQHLGWKLVEEPVRYRQPSGDVLSPVCMLTKSRNGEWPRGAVEIGSLPW